MKLDKYFSVIHICNVTKEEINKSDFMMTDVCPSCGYVNPYDEEYYQHYTIIPVKTMRMSLFEKMFLGKRDFMIYKNNWRK